MSKGNFTQETVQQSRSGFISSSDVREIIKKKRQHSRYGYVSRNFEVEDLETK